MAAQEIIGAAGCAAPGEISADMRKRYGPHVQLVNVEPEEPVDYGRLLRWLF